MTTKIIGVYDNGGKTLDRYTVVTDQNYSVGKATFYEGLGLSDDPTDPQFGFSQFGDVLDARDEHKHFTQLGQSIGWDDLPKNVRQHAWGRIYPED